MELSLRLLDVQRLLLACFDGRSFVIASPLVQPVFRVFVGALERAAGSHTSMLNTSFELAKKCPVMALS